MPNTTHDEGVFMNGSLVRQCASKHSGRQCLAYSESRIKREFAGGLPVIAIVWVLGPMAAAQCFGFIVGLLGLVVCLASASGQERCYSSDN